MSEAETGDDGTPRGGFHQHTVDQDHDGPISPGVLEADGPRAQFSDRHLPPGMSV